VFSVFVEHVCSPLCDSVQRPRRGRSTQSKVSPVRWASSDFRAAAVLAGHCLQPYGFTDALGRVPLEEPPGCLRSSGTRTFVFHLAAWPVWGASGAYHLDNRVTRQQVKR
jgi:hypothetical protein